MKKKKTTSNKVFLVRRDPLMCIFCTVKSILLFMTVVIIIKKINGVDVHWTIGPPRENFT